MAQIKLKEMLKISFLPIITASLCCLSPILLVLLGLSTTAFAASLADTLYGTYKWAFRSVGLLLLAISLIVYFRKENICTFDQAKRKRNQIINTVLVTLIIGILGYIFWLYVVVEYIGKWLNIWQ